MKGEFENRLKNVIEEVKASPTPIILFIAPGVWRPPWLLARLRRNRRP